MSGWNVMEWLGQGFVREAIRWVIEWRRRPPSTPPEVIVVTYSKDVLTIESVDLTKVKRKDFDVKGRAA
jgi:hypothetical protein